MARIIRKSQSEAGQTLRGVSGAQWQSAAGGARLRLSRSRIAKVYRLTRLGAVFAEVAVDGTLGMPRVRRMVAMYDIGTLLNEKTGKSQLIGGIVWGVSFALHQETHWIRGMGVR